MSTQTQVLVSGIVTILCWMVTATFAPTLEWYWWVGAGVLNFPALWYWFDNFRWGGMGHSREILRINLAPAGALGFWWIALGCAYGHRVWGWSFWGWLATSLLVLFFLTAITIMVMAKNGDKQRKAAIERRQIREKMQELARLQSLGHEELVRVLDGEMWRLVRHVARMEVNKGTRPSKEEAEMRADMTIVLVAFYGQNKTNRLISESVRSFLSSNRS